MIPYYGTHGSRQRINKKSICVGYNIWVLAEVYRHVVQFEPYQGVKKGKQFASSFKWGLGENVVLRLMECLSQTVSYKFMNNYFRSFCMLTHFGVSNIRAAGVFNKIRLHKRTIIGDK